MLYFLLLAFYSSSLFISAHDIPLGVFRLNLEEEQILLDIKLEAQDVEKALALNSKLDKIDQEVGRYILGHTSWSINDVLLVPEICSIEQQQDHYFIKINFPKPDGVLHNMTIVNDCLVAEIDNHSNIIYIQQNGMQRGFRLHKDRISTTFNFR